jgi:1-deoxy-D-xylulose-5-phosphate reductoisomerase
MIEKNQINSIVLLGSTGSIGVNTLIVASKNNIKIEALIAGKNIELLNQQIKEFNPKYVVIADKADIKRVNHTDVRYGENGIIEVLNLSKSNLVVNALVGFTGLKPSLETLKLNKKLALANKESLVVAGEFIDCSKIIPIDSEHFGLRYLIDESKSLDSLIVTASGGAFRDFDIDRLSNVTIKEALNHPNWSMGNKITIDSATMVNKLFEVLEAYHLFDCKKIDAVIETQSLIHAIINFKDGSSTAHFAHADMKLPIAYALLNKDEKIEENIVKPIDFQTLSTLEFRKIDIKRYPIWDIKEYMLDNPHLGVVLNSTNDVMVERFLNSKCSFLDISKTILNTLEKFSNAKASNINELFEIDKEVFEFINKT